MLPLRNNHLISEGINSSCLKIKYSERELNCRASNLKDSVARAKNSLDTPNIVSDLINEVIKSFDQNKGVVFAFELYGSLAAAQKDSPKYQKLISAAKIIGLYKDRVIGISLASQFHPQFKFQHN